MISPRLAVAAIVLTVAIAVPSAMAAESASAKAEPHKKCEITASHRTAAGSSCDHH